MNRATARRAIATALLVALLPLTMAAKCGEDKDCKPDQKGFQNCTHGGCKC